MAISPARRSPSTTLAVRLRRLPRNFLILTIRGYRLLVSPIVGPSCRFQPTCSAYAIEALESHGLLRGGLLALRRLGRCHPVSWLGGGQGFDPVPPHHHARAHDV